MTLLGRGLFCPLSGHCNAVRPARQSPVNPSDNPAATDSSPHTGARIASLRLFLLTYVRMDFYGGRFAPSPSVSQMVFSAVGATRRSPLHHHDRKKLDYR